MALSEAALLVILARLQVQAMLRDALIDAISRRRLDALLLPYSLVGASRVGESRVDGTNSLASHAGLPSVVVPAGHSGAGLPIAAQLIARPYPTAPSCNWPICSTRPPPP